MITAEILDNPRQRRHSLLPATLGESVGAAYEEGAILGRPGEAISRRQQEKRLAGEGDDFLGMLPIQSPQVDVGEIISAREANRRYQHLGLNFDAPIPDKLANLRAKKKQAEIRRQDILARGPGGILPGSAQFGAMFVSALMDPINIAASFVPVVGQSRYAAMIARLGTTKARASRGAIEGVVGNTMVEPFIFSQAKREQLDYTMTDALVNVAFGGLIGGGLHVGGGKLADIAKARAEAGLAKADARAEIRSAVNEVSDYVDAQTPEARQAALRTSVAQLVGDNRVNVKPVFDAEQIEAVRINNRMTIRAAAEEDTVMVVSLDELAEKVEGISEPAKAKRALPQSATGMRVEMVDGKLVGEPSALISQLRARGAKVAAISVDRRQARDIASVLEPKKAPDAIETNLRALADEKGYDSARIDELHGRVGGDLEELKEALRRGSREGRYILDKGDASLAGAEGRAAAVDVDGTPYHRVRLAPKATQTRKRTRPSKAEQKRIVESEEDIDDTPRPREMEETEDVETQRQQAEQEGLDDLFAQAEAEGLDVSTLTKEVDEMEAEYNKAIDEAVRCTIGR